MSGEVNQHLCSRHSWAPSRALFQRKGKSCEGRAGTSRARGASGALSGGRGFECYRLRKGDRELLHSLKSILPDAMQRER